MSNIQTMYDAVEFIEHNLKEEISVADMADAVSYSLYHFCRTFNKVVHHTPYDYLMRRRLTESALELRETDRRIIDIAFDYCFNNPETYSRAFKRMFGTQPSQWKKRDKIDSRFLMSKLTLAHIRHINEKTSPKPILVEKDAFRVAGVMALVQHDHHIISRLWDILQQELENRTGDDYYGIIWYPKDWEARGFLYMAAVEAWSFDIVDSALVIKEIPARKYARFTHKGAQVDLKLTRDYIYQTWLPKSGEALACPMEIEVYRRAFGDFDTEGTERQILIPIR